MELYIKKGEIYVLKKIGKIALIAVGSFIGLCILIVIFAGDKKEATPNIRKEVERQEVKPTVKEQEKPKQTTPVTLGSGEYIAGKDFQEGRYRATNVGRGSNFQVYSDRDRLKVNTILGDSEIGNGDYTFFAETGDKVKTAAKIKLIPVS